MNRIKIIEYYPIRNILFYHPDTYVIKRYLKGLFKSNKLPLKIDDFSLLQTILMYKESYNAEILHIIEYV